MVEIEQRLYARRVEDIPAAVARACAAAGVPERIARKRRSGRARPSVGITVGSRGIANIAGITKALVEIVKQAGGKPFILPAMGSHGGATPAGQTAVLASLGVTPASVGAPIRASMAVEQIGETKNGVEVFVSREAMQADGVIVMNRIKQHTDFVGPYESGLAKMIAIGLGKRKGAAAMHGRRCQGLREDIPEAARMALRKAPILAALAILENGYNQTAQIVGLSPDQIMERERSLLQRARRTAGRLPFREIDLLLVNWIGKDISGIGMDTHVVCRRMIWEEPEFRGIKIQLIAALDLTEGSRGNALGLGLADLITDRLRAKIDVEALKTNVLHTGWLNRAKIPLSFANDREVVRAAFVALGDPDPGRVRIARIRDTLHLGRLWISEGLLSEARRNPRVRVVGRPAKMRFDREGNLA
jgi:hypothetical protein